MNKTFRLAPILLVGAMLSGCFLFESEPFVPSTIVALGDSITMGIQDAGLSETFQSNCYPYLVATQMGQARGFVQPLVSAASGGIGVPPYETPLRLENGHVKTDYLPEGISQEALMALIVPKLQNLFYPDPYNNLGVNGARLDDLNHATGYATSYNGDNFFYDIVLRNLEAPYPNIGEGKTAVEQAAQLDPEYIFLWIGNNDILGYVLSGGEMPARITDAALFESELRDILDYLTSNTTAQILLGNIPEYLPFGYALDGVFVGGSPKIFDPTSLQPLDFDPGEGVLYIDLHLQAEDAGTVEHLLLTAAGAYVEAGMGVDPADLNDAQKALLASKGVSVPATAVPLTRELAFADVEESLTLDTIETFNGIIQTVALEYGLPVVDINSWMKPGVAPSAASPLPDDSCLGFALVSRNNTIFSLDGVHPSSYGHAFIANEFIKTMNAQFGLSIPLLNTDDYDGQYGGAALVVPSMKAIRRLGEMYAPLR